MTFSVRNPGPDSVDTSLTVDTSSQKVGSLPATWRKRDLALLIILVTIIVPDMRGMQSAGHAVFFYWSLALFTFQLPSILVFGWLTRQAPWRVPIYTWLLRLLDDRWRSVILFLMCWTGVLLALAALGICLNLLEPPYTSWFSTLPVQCLVFVVLLILATLLVSLPAHILKIVLWIGGLLFMATFVLVAVAVPIFLTQSRNPAGILLQPALTRIPRPFSWAVFGLTLLSLFGLNGPLLLDGEMRGGRRFLRGSTGYLWWGGLGSFFILILCSTGWIITHSDLQFRQGRLFLAIGPVLGQQTVTLGWLLLLLGSFACALAYLLVFSRAFFLAARMGYLPRRLARLNRSGTPVRAILAQSAMIACAALLFFVIGRALLELSLPRNLVMELKTGDQFSLLTSIAGSLWCLLNALMFIFAFWLFLKKRRYMQRNPVQRLVLPILCLFGCLSSLVCTIAPLLPDWPSLFFSQEHWFPLVLLGVACSLALAWMINELPRRAALVREKEKSLAREKTLREELQHAYTRERGLNDRLHEAYDSQQISILRQKLLLDEVNRLCREQEQAARTDVVTGLLNHRAFVEYLEKEIAHCRTEAATFLLFFLDVDHFKAINDTWGHLAGDAVLREVAQRLRHALRSVDIVGRYGGEEFAVIMSDAPITEAHKQGERLRQLIRSTPCNWQGRETEEAEGGINVTVSIGVAACGIHGTCGEDLIESADRAMYQAKRDGRDCVRVAIAQAPIARQRVLAARTLASASYEQVEEQARNNENRTHVSLQTLRALATVLQARDETTSVHCSRVIWLAEETGRRLGASPDDLLLIRLAGFFHDIGKVAIPDAVLNKAGPLDEEEWTIMRRHPVIGAHILESVGGFFQRLAPIVQAHHERWDGYGYPQGLKGEEIPLAARVLAVADSYDTMLSRRPYKEPMLDSAARAELRHNAGTQFDPAVVQAFLAVLQIPQPDQASLEAKLRWDSLVSEGQALFEDAAQFESTAQ